MEDKQNTVNEPNKKRKKGTGSAVLEQKKLKMAGKGYRTYKNTLRPAKKEPNEAITCKCKFQCTTLSFECKIKLFTDFYEQSFETQGTYLMGLVQIASIKRRRHGSYQDVALSRRQCTPLFAVPNGQGNIIQVCRNTFMDIFAVTRQRLQTIINKKKFGEYTFKDKRTRTAAPKFSIAHRDLVRQHIQSIPKDISHYSRNKSTKLYLSPDLNISRLYRAFQNKHPTSSISHSYYREVFRKDFPNLSFKRPRTDTCKTCDLLDNKIKLKNEESAVAKVQLEVHHRKSEKARTVMKEDITYSQRPGSNTCVLSMDLEQVLFVPTLTHCEMFYLRQLSCFNFEIRLEDNGQPIMCMWNESIGNRGGNEISSCLLKLLNDGITDKKQLVIWSDNCCGQNKNRMIVFTLLFLVSLGVFDTIEQRFLVSGHSFLSCDRDFAQVEKRKRVMKSFIPSDLIDVVKSAKVATPFHVVEMEENTFLDFQAAANEIIDISKLKITKAVALRYEANDPSVVLSKQTHSTELWTTTKVLKKGKSPQDIRRTALGPAVNKAISEEKKQNLRAMMPFLKDPRHRDFYVNIT